MADELTPADKEVNDFVASLRELHEEAGRPSLRAMSRTAHYSHTALSNVLGGGRLPSLELTLAFVRACGGDEDAWRAAWARTRQRIDAARADGVGAELAIPPQEPAAPVPAAWRSRLRLIAVLGAGTAIAVAALVFLGLALTRGPAASPSHRLRSAAHTSPVCKARPDPGDRPLIPCDDSRFIADVTIPDGTVVRANHTFVKTWEIKNSGLVTWRGRYEERQGLQQGQGICTSPSRVPVPTTLPGQDVKISVPFTAPSLPGSCWVQFRMTNSQGRLYFPYLAGIYVTVNVTG